MGRGINCTYELIAGPAEYTVRDESDPSCPSDVFTQEHEAVEEVPPGVTTNTSLVTITPPAPKVIPPAHAFSCPLGHDGASSSTSLESLQCAFGGARMQGSPHVALPTFSTRFPPTPPGIPPEPHVTLLSLGAGNFHLSDAALGELDTKLYVSLRCSLMELIRPFSRLGALSRLNKMGILFTSQKQQALLRGDTSGAVIHPFFIPAAQSVGMHFFEGMDDSPVMIKRQARHIQRSLEILADIFKGHDLELTARAALWITAATIITTTTHFSHFYLKKSCEAIDTSGLQFIPTYGRPPEFSEELHEKLSLLSQAIYFENYLFLTHGGAEPTMTARLEKGFRHQLQVQAGSPQSTTQRA